MEQKQIDAFEAMLGRGQDSDMLRYTLGNAYFAHAQYHKAIVHLRQACQMNPSYSTAWKLLGRALAEDGQAHEAVDAFDTALTVAEENGDKQVAKEVGVFRRRVIKQLDSEQNGVSADKSDVSDASSTLNDTDSPDQS